MFFNAPYFKQRVMAAAAAGGPDLKWFVLDLIPVTIIDVTGLSVMRELATTLQARGVVVGTAGRQTEWDHWFARHGIERLTGIRAFPTLSDALEAYRNADGRKSGSS